MELQNKMQYQYCSKQTIKHKPVRVFEKIQITKLILVKRHLCLHIQTCVAGNIRSGILSFLLPTYIYGHCW